MNKKGLPEEMLTCSECGSSGHPSCMKMSADLAYACTTYDWLCMECKRCEICNEVGDDVSNSDAKSHLADQQTLLMFCDRCDKAYHTYCVDPPQQKPPEGKRAALSSLVSDVRFLGM